MSDKLQIIPESEPLVMPARSPMELLAMAVQKGGMDVGAMKELVAMANAERDRQAKMEFDAALASFQSECPVILKTVAGAQGKYKFAPLDHIISKTRHLLEKHGFSFTLTADCDATSVAATIRVTHRSGHFRDSTFKVPTDQRNNLMNAAQAIGGAMTFAKRYAFCNAFGILTADEDKDGQVAGTKEPFDPLKPKTTVTEGEPLKDAKAKLWRTLAGAPRGDTPTAKATDWGAAQRWLIDELDIQIAVSDMSVAELQDANRKAESRLKAGAI